jgi:hypothetical protein
MIERLKKELLGLQKEDNTKKVRTAQMTHELASSVLQQQQATLELDAEEKKMESLNLRLAKKREQHQSRIAGIRKIIEERVLLLERQDERNKKKEVSGVVWAKQGAGGAGERANNLVLLRERSGGREERTSAPTTSSSSAGKAGVGRSGERANNLVLLRERSGGREERTSAQQPLLLVLAKRGLGGAARALTTSSPALASLANLLLLRSLRSQPPSLALATLLLFSCAPPSL